MADSSWWIDANELDDEQKDVISLPPDGDYLVVGPPGSGKTNLLALRASYLTRTKKPNVVVLMFTRSLREFVAKGCNFYSVSEANIKTIMLWEQELLREHHVEIDREGKSFDDIRKEHAKALAKVFDEKPALEKHLDCILVDEVQDCLPEEIELFFRSAKNVFFVGDKRQQIYDGCPLHEQLDGRVITKTLSKHYRNGVQICHAADSVGKSFGEEPMIGTCNYDETKAKSSVTFERCSDDADLFRKLTLRLSQQLKAYPDELLGVICPRRSEVDKVRANLCGDSEMAPYILDEGALVDIGNSLRRIYVCTMHDAKGLEFRALHIAFAEHTSKMREHQKRLVFTGITRAKTSLSVYHISPLPGYFEQAHEAVTPPKAPPAVHELFPNRLK